MRATGADESSRRRSSKTDTYSICQKQLNERCNVARAKIGPAPPQPDPPAEKLVACRQTADTKREETLKLIYEAKDEKPPHIKFGKTLNEIQAKNISDITFEECVNPALVLKTEQK